MQSGQWNHLETLDIVCMILENHSGKVRDKWIVLVMKVRRREQREATLCDFVDFISEETTLVNDTLFSKEAKQQSNEKRSSRQENAKKRISTFVTNSKKYDIIDLQKDEISCITCEKVMFCIL